MTDFRAAVNKGNIAVLSTTEANRIFESILNPMVRTALFLVYCCGVRFWEVASLRVSDIDFRRNTIFVRGFKRPNRIVPLSGEALKAINDWLQRPQTTTEWLFPCGEGHISATFLQRAFRAAMLKCGIDKPASAQILRNSFTINLLEKGLDPIIVQSVLGLRWPQHWLQGNKYSDGTT